MFARLVMFLVGMALGLSLGSLRQPRSDYEVEVLCQVLRDKINKWDRP